MLPPAKGSWRCCHKLRGEPIVGLLSHKWGFVVRLSSWWEKAAARRQVGEWYSNNDDTEGLRILFSLPLVSVLQLREMMLSYKVLCVVMCWGCLHLSNFVPWEHLTDSCIAEVLFWSMIIKKKTTLEDTGTVYATFHHHICLQVFSPKISESAWIDLLYYWQELRKVVGCSLSAPGSLGKRSHMNSP